MPLLSKDIFGDAPSKEVFSGTEADSNTTLIKIGRMNAENTPVIHSRMRSTGFFMHDESGNALDILNNSTGVTKVVGGGIRGGDAFDYDGATGFAQLAISPGGVPQFKNWVEYTVEAWVQGPAAPVVQKLNGMVFLADLDGGFEEFVALFHTFFDVPADRHFLSGSAILCGDDGVGGLDALSSAVGGDNPSGSNLQYMALRYKLQGAGETSPTLVANVNGNKFEFDFFGIREEAVKAIGSEQFTRVAFTNDPITVPSGTIVKTAGGIRFATTGSLQIDGGAKATGEVTFTKTGPATGLITIPAGTRVQTAGGETFETSEEVVLDADVESTVDADIVAQLFGTDGNVSAATITVIVDPVAGIASVTNANATAGGITADANGSIGIIAVVAGVSGNIAAPLINVLETPITDVASVANLSPTALGSDEVSELDALGNPRQFLGSEHSTEPFLRIGQWPTMSEFTEMRLAGLRITDKYLTDDELDYILNSSYSYTEDFGGPVNGTYVTVTATIGTGQAINLIIETSEDNFISLSGRAAVALRTGVLDYTLGLIGRHWRFTFNFSTQDPTTTPNIDTFTLEGYDVETTTALKRIKNNLPHTFGLKASDILDQFLARFSVATGEAITQSDLAIKMIFLHLAGGVWLDRHGEWFNIPRKIDEDDDTYNERIIFEITRARANNKALELIVQSIGLSVTIIDLGRRADILGGTQSDRKALFGVILSVSKVYTEISLADRIALYNLLDKHKAAGTYMVFLTPSAFLITTDLLADPDGISVVNESLGGQRFPVGPIGGLFEIVSIADFIGLDLKYQETPFTDDVDSWAYFLFKGNMSDEKSNLNNAVRNRLTVVDEVLDPAGAPTFVGATSGKLANFPVEPGSVHIDFGLGGSADDDGIGGFTGGVSAGTIDYVNGDISVTSSNPSDVTANCDYVGGPNADFVPSGFDQSINHSATIGDTDLSNVSEITHPAAFTVDLLIKPASFQTPSTNNTIIVEKSDKVVTNWEYEISLLDVGGQLRFRCRFEDGVSGITLESGDMGTELDLQFWIRVVFDDAHATEKVKLFVDGVKVATSGTAMVRNNPTQLFIPGEDAGNNDFLGSVDELMISNVARG